MSVVYTIFISSENVASTVYCRQPLNKKDVKLLTYAIKNHYWYQMYLDDLPIWAIVGEQGADKEFTVWTHRSVALGGLLQWTKQMSNIVKFRFFFSV